MSPESDADMTRPETVGFDETGAPRAIDDDPRHPRPGPGTQLDGRYELMDRLGQGGMGEVWRARQHNLDREVAIKLLAPGLAEHPDVVERFWREARIMGQLGHENVVQVLDVSAPDREIPYIAMELLTGETLRSFMDRRGGRTSGSVARFLIRQLLDGLCVAHEHGVVHRDIKPSNLFVVPHRGSEAGRLKILDFGASKLVENVDMRLTTTGSIIGTPMYMAPEQAAGSSSLDARTDLYAAAVVYYELLTGTLPHEANNLNALLISLATQDPISIRTRRTELPLAYDAFFAKALAREASERFADARAMLAALAKLPSESGAAVEPDGPPDEAPSAATSSSAELLAVAVESAASAAQLASPADAMSLNTGPSPVVSPSIPALGDSAVMRREQELPPSLMGLERMNTDALLPVELQEVDTGPPPKAGKRWSAGGLGVGFLGGLAAGALTHQFQLAKSDELEVELSQVVNKPSSIREGARRPSEIEAELAAAESEALMYGGGAGLATFIILALLVGRRRG